MKTLSFLVLFSLLLSCEQDSINEVIIGNGNENLSITKLDPFLIIDGLNKDSLDINSDGNFDIIFTKSPKPALTGFSTETTISIKNNVQILLSSINSYPDTLSYKTVVDNNSNWSKNQSSTYALESFKCNSNNCPNIGNFQNVTDKYIGFKLAKIIGWIKVDISPSEVKIKEYTIIK